MNIWLGKGNPYYFVRGGDIIQNTDYLFNVAGDYGNYWSSTAYSITNRAYVLAFWSINIVYPFTYGGQQNAFSLRCLAR